MISSITSAALLIIVFILFLGTIPALILWDHRQQARTATKLSQDIQPCTLCHEQRAGLKLHQTALTGLLLAANYKYFNNYVCPPHARALYSQFQQHTLLKGWWSLHGFIRTPITLLENLSYFKQYMQALAANTSNTPK